SPGLRTSARVVDRARQLLAPVHGVDVEDPSPSAASCPRRLRRGTAPAARPPPFGLLPRATGIRAGDRAGRQRARSCSTARSSCGLDSEGAGRLREARWLRRHPGTLWQQRLAAPRAYRPTERSTAPANV